MNKFKTFASIVIAMLFCFSISAQELGIIPHPNSITYKKGSLALSQNLSVSTKGIDKATSDFLVSQVYGNTTSTSKGNIKIELTKQGSEEAYTLNVNRRGITIRSASRKGLFNGIATLNQILYQTKTENGHNIPYVNIVDQPAYSYRGFMLDASRHFQSVEKVKKVLDFMASLKLNVFHWHLTDDQGWRIESKKYPKINTVASYMDIEGAYGRNNEANGYYTHDQIRDILAYAAQRNIEVIPEIDIPGHNFAILTAFPEFRCAEALGSNAFDGANEEGIAFIKAVFDEVIEVFNPRYIHIGGDERVKGLWENCANCQEKMKRLGIENENDLQNHYLNEIAQHIHKQGVITMAWAENLEGGIPEGQITQAWHNGEGQMAVKKGHKVVVSDHMHNYLDYPENPVQKETKPAWMPILSVETLYNYDFTYPGLTKEQEALILGGECPLWTEEIMEKDIYPQIKQRIEAHAERSWTNKDRKNLDRFRKSFDTLEGYLTDIIE